MQRVRFDLLKLAVWLAALFTLAACGGQVQQLEDGRYSVDCPGGYHDWVRCDRSARRTCGNRDPVVVSRVSTEAGNVGTRDWSSEGSMVSRRMIFQCQNDS